MTQLFDAYENSYRDEVQSSIDFSGLSHAFFVSAKAELIQNLVKARFTDGKKPDALDIGCGVGMFHPFIRNSFGRLSGVDVSASCIGRARSENSDVEYKTYEGAVLPYRDAEFDFAMTICVMHHVPPAEWASFMREMRRVTRPGGTLCVIEHNPLNPLTRLAVARCEFDRDAVLLRSGVTEGLMDKAGLRDIETDFFLFFPSAAKILRSIERAISWMPLGAQYATVGRV
jgi:ubiquinone/menaquinone biosynthesis C-methylase UbiE